MIDLWLGEELAKLLCDIGNVWSGGIQVNKLSMSRMYDGISANGSASSWQSFIMKQYKQVWIKDDQSLQEDQNNTSFGIMEIPLQSEEFPSLEYIFKFLDP